MFTGENYLQKGRKKGPCHIIIPSRNHRVTKPAMHIRPMLTLCLNPSFLYVHLVLSAVTLVYWRKRCVYFLTNINIYFQTKDTFAADVQKEWFDWVELEISDVMLTQHTKERCLIFFQLLYNASKAVKFSRFIHARRLSVDDTQWWIAMRAEKIRPRCKIRSFSFVNSYKRLLGLNHVFLSFLHSLSLLKKTTF